MKKLILGIFVIISIFGCAGMETIPEAQRSHEQTYDVPGLNKDQLFDKTLAWMAETFVSSKAVIELKDKENGKIIGNGVTSIFNGLITFDVSYTLIIDIKNNKIRMTFKNLQAKDIGPITTKLVMDKCLIEFQKLGDKLIFYLSQTENKNW